MGFIELEIYNFYMMVFKGIWVVGIRFVGKVEFGLIIICLFEGINLLNLYRVFSLGLDFGMDEVWFGFLNNLWFV